MARFNYCYTGFDNQLYKMNVQELKDWLDDLCGELGKDPSDVNVNIQVPFGFVSQAYKSEIEAYHNDEDTITLTPQ